MEDQNSKGVIRQFQDEYRFLSNFWPSPIQYEGIVFPSVEHAFQAAKTTDESARKHVAQLSTPGGAKRAGRQLTLRPGWENIKVSIMTELVRRKFIFHPPLMEKLLATRGQALQEGNSWGDTFWGVDLKMGKGENMLGKILMGTREELWRTKIAKKSAESSKKNT